MLLDSLLNANYGRPEAFWLIALCVPLAFFMRRQTIYVLLLRCIVVSLLAFALADPFEVETESEEELSAVVDVSASMSNKALKASLRELKKFPNAKISLVPFAKKPGASIALEPGWADNDVLRQLEAVRAGLDSGDTDLSKALWSAEEQSSSGSILVLSDGFETLGSAREAASDLASRGLKIFPLLADETAFLDSALTLESLYAPLTLNSGDKATIRTTVSNSFSEERSGSVEIWLDSKKLETAELTIGGTSEKLFSVETPEIKGGLKRIRTVLKIDGEEPQELHRWISVKERSKVLMLSGKNEDARTLPRLLRLKGYALDSRVLDGSERAPDSLKNFSSVILNNAARRQLPGSFLTKLEKFVAAGGGLIILGGDRSFGLGGYTDTPLETVSPVKFVPPRTKKKRVTNGVVLVMDKSKSMAYQGKIHAAKLAALTSISTLKDDDLVSVIGFDSAPFVIIRLAKVKDVKPNAERRLRNLTAAGKTNLWPALASARQALRTSDAGRKHIIVLSDGKIPLGRNNYPEELKRARKEGITISAVALGAEADLQFMKFMAKNGKGSFYHTLDPSRLPEIFVKDIKVSTGEETLNEKQDFPVRIGPAGLQSVRGDRRFPELRGFVETLPKKGSDLELITFNRRRPHPILASWSYKKGKVAAYTSDANGRWSVPWLKWKGVVNFWTDLLESVKPKKGEKATEIDFDLRYSVSGKELTFDLAVFDQALSTKAAPRIEALVEQPGGERETLVFEATAKGRFKGILKGGRPGDYKLDISYGPTKLPELGLTLSGETFGEQSGQGLNVQALSELAYDTGGVMNPSPERLKGIRRITKESKRLFGYPLSLAFFLIILEAIARELGPLLYRRLFGRRNSPTRSKAASYGPRRRAA